MVDTVGMWCTRGDTMIWEGGQRSPPRKRSNHNVCPCTWGWLGGRCRGATSCTPSCSEVSVGSCMQPPSPTEVASSIDTSDSGDDLPSVLHKCPKVLKCCASKRHRPGSVAGGWACAQHVRALRSVCWVSADFLLRCCFLCARRTAVVTESSVSCAPVAHGDAFGRGTSHCISWHQIAPLPHRRLGQS